MELTELPMPRTRAILEQGIAQRLHLGAQLHVSTNSGAADIAIGESRPGQPMRSDDLVLWLSSCKPITAAAIMQLVERGKLQLDDPVTKHIPEFARHGKQAITLRHLLTHTAGIRSVPRTVSGRSWDQILAEICEAPLEPRWVPGDTAGYHAASSWFLLGELIQRVTGQSFSQHIRREVLEPLGMRDSWIGMPVEQFRQYGDRIVPMNDTRDTEADIVNPHPGANGRGPVRELGRFYEAFRGALVKGQPTILSLESIRQMTRRQRQGKYDKTFKHIMDWGLGFIINSQQYGEDVPYGYGPHASPQTFGHSGSRSSCAFCDPVHGIVAAWMCNGTPTEPAHQRRQRAINEAIYQDLGFAPRPA